MTRMRLTPALLMAVLAMLLSQPGWARRAPIGESPALKHSESLMADAEKEGAPDVVPNLWLDALQKLNAAYDAYHKQVEANARDDDREAVAAQRAAEDAEVDAELALVSAQATKDEARAGGSGSRSSRSSGYRQAVPASIQPVYPTPGQYPSSGDQP
jgi:hypothetical protein